MTRPTTVQVLGVSATIVLALFLASSNFFLFHATNSDPYEPTNWGQIIGIEFGLKHSRVGVFRNGTFEIIPDEGRSIVPSIVAFTGAGRHLVGFEAQKQASENPRGTIHDIRNLIGANFSDPVVKKKITDLPFDFVKRLGSNGAFEIKVRTESGDISHSPEHIASLFLERLKNMAEHYLNTTVSSAVISVPAYFNQDQRDALKFAGKMAKLEILRIINEPTAAAIAHRLDTWDTYGGESDFYGGTEEFHIAIYDIQETESDLTLLSIDRGVFEVKATAHQENNGEARLRYLKALQYLPSIIQSHLSRMGTQSPGKLFQAIQQLLLDAGVDKKFLDGILVTGNPSLAVNAQLVLGSYFGSEKLMTSSSISSDQAIVYGAAMQGELLSETERDSGNVGHYMDATQLSIGVEASNGTFHTIIWNGTVYPTRKSIVVSTSFDNQERVVLDIWEGQRLIANKNRLIGTLELAGLSLRPKGVSRLQVTLEVDANRILRATVQELESEIEINTGIKKLVEFVVRPKKSDYTQDIVAAIYEDAERFREEDISFLAELSKTSADEHEGARGEFGIIIR